MKSLYNYRIANNLDINNVADFLNIDVLYYNSCESGEFELDRESLEKLADLYGIEVSDFYNDNIVKNSILRYIFNASNRTIVLNSDLKEIARFRRVIKEYEKMSLNFSK